MIRLVLGKTPYDVKLLVGEGGKQVDLCQQALVQKILLKVGVDKLPQLTVVLLGVEVDAEVEKATVTQGATTTIHGAEEDPQLLLPKWMPTPAMQFGNLALDDKTKIVNSDGKQING